MAGIVPVRREWAVADAKRGASLLAENRKAKFDYELFDRFEAGMVLTGPEVKAVRAGGVSFSGAYVETNAGELWLSGCSFSKLDVGAFGSRRGRIKLLCRRREIEKIRTATDAKGLTAVPLSIVDLRGRLKLVFALARGRKAHDKRRAIRDRDMAKETV